MKNKKLFSFLILILIAASAFWYLFMYRKPAADIKHVILISVDTCRADYLGCYGCRLSTTPKIDELAEQAFLFENVVSPVPITLPAHSSMLTGTIPPFHGVHNNVEFVLTDAARTLPEILRETGFQTTAIVSAFVLDNRFGLNQGFDSYNDKFQQARHNIYGSERGADETTNLAIQWAQKNKDQKSFLFLHYYDPHAVYEPPEPFASRFADDLYAGEIAYTDHCIGLFINELKKLGIYDSSLIMIAGDHGEMLGEHGEPEHTYFIYNAAVKVPLIVKLPGQTESKRIPEIAGLVDIVPTLCQIIDLPIPPNVHGRDLLKFNRGETSEQQRYIYTESLTPTRLEANSLMSVTDDRFRYIQTTRPELYDLVEDPGENNNLIDQQPQRAKIMQDRLRLILEQAAKDSTEDGKIQLDRQAINILESLGYVAGTTTTDFSFDQSKDDPKDLIEFFVSLQEANLLVYRKEYDKAEDIYKKLIQDRSTFHEAYSKLGLIAREKKDYPQAVTYCKEAVRLRPDNTQYRASLGTAYGELGQFPQAVQQYQEALRLNPDNSSAHYDLAAVLFRMGDFSKAAEHYQKVLEVRPEDGLTHYHMGLTMLKLQKYDDAEKYFTQALRLDPQNFEACNYLGYIMTHKRDLKKTIGHYKKSLQINDRQIMILNNVAWIGATFDNPWPGSIEEAENMAKRACELSNFEYPVTLDTLAAASAAAGKFDTAVEYAKKAIALAQAANDTKMAEQIKEHLKMYEDRKPYLDPDRVNWKYK